MKDILIYRIYLIYKVFNLFIFKFSLFLYVIKYICYFMVNDYVLIVYYIYDFFE